MDDPNLLPPDGRELIDLEEGKELLQAKEARIAAGSGESMPDIGALQDIPIQINDGIQEAAGNAQQQIQEGVNQATQNVQQGLSGAIENLQTNVGAWMRGRTPQEEAAWREQQIAAHAEARQAFQDQSTDPLAEGIRAVSGGTMEAVESVGDFAELTGDTIKTKINQAFGRPVDATQDPWSEEYIRGDSSWLDIPDHIVPENRTAMGKLARGFVEFGVLLATTRGVGNVLGAGGTISATGTRAAGVGGAGNKFIQFVKAGGRVAAEGAAAEFIMDDEGNMMNLIQDHTPWMSPWVKNVLGVNALAVHPDDNPWLSKIKTVTVGAGFNLVGHTIAAFAKGKWAAKQAVKKGSDNDSANEIGNQVFQDEWLLNRQLDEVAANQMAADRLVNENKGLPLNSNREDYILNKLDDVEAADYLDPNVSPERQLELELFADQRGAEIEDVFNFARDEAPSQVGRQPDPFVNPRSFGDSERATLRPDIGNAVKKNIKESIVNAKNGAEGRSYSPLLTETALRQISRGDRNIREWVEEVSEDIADAAFKDLDNTLDQKEVQRLALTQAAELHELVAKDGGKGAVKRLKEHFKKGENGIVWIHDGDTVITGNASQKIALQLLVNTLMKQASAVARGTLEIADDVPINRQVEQIFDLTKVALIEHKKIGYMAGSELADMKPGSSLSPTRRKAIQKRLGDIAAEEEELFENLAQLYLKGEEGAMDDLWELYALSDGNVRSMEHIHEFLKAKIRGGDMGRGKIPGEFRHQMQSTFYNSILSALKTPIDAITSTTMIATSRPAQQWVGAAIKLDRKEMAIATSGIQALGDAWRESIEMAKYNWDLSLQRKNQTYMGRYDAAGDLSKWKDLAPYYEQYGTAVEKRAYQTLDKLVTMNTSPWMKYSANAMGAGDALARTIIGRMKMRMDATREAIEKGVDLNDAKLLARKTEENFRRKIFKKNSDGKWVVSDKATNLAGDETTMTKALEGWLQVFEGIQKAPLGRVFFPFVRTGVNALDLTWQHSPAGIFHQKYNHLKKGLYLDKYGLTADNVAGELALMEGRIAIGSAVVGMATLATLNGHMTGDYPYNKIDRDLWIAKGIKPYSFKFKNPLNNKDYYVSYEELEPFNTVFSTAANLVQNSHIFGEDIKDHWGEKLIFMTSAVLVDKSFLSGVKDLSSLLTPNRAEGQFMKTFTKFGRSHLPYAGLLGEIGTIMDANKKEAHSFLELAFQRDAMLKSFMYPKYDILSKNRKPKPLNYAADSVWWRIFSTYSPIGVTPIEDDPVKQALVNIRYNLPDEMSHINGMPLNSKMRSELSKYMSQTGLYRELQKIIENPAWNRSYQEYKRNGFLESKGNIRRNQLFYIPINQAFRQAKKEAWEMVLASNPDLREHIYLYKAKQEASKAGRYNQLSELNKHGN